jgi:hypothetical protein
VPGPGVVGPGISQPGAGGGGSGTVTSVSVATANGFAGTVANPTTTPAISVQTSITAPALAGNGTAISAATTTGTGSTVVLSVSPTFTGTPTAPTATAGDNTTQVATDAFVTTAVANAIAGVNPAVAVSAATTAAANTSTWTYNNGTSGIGATFTGPVNTAITIDGFTFTTITTQSLLVKNDTQSPSGAFNGVYVLTALQTVGTGAIFTRRLDYDQPSDINNTGAIPVVNGTVNALTSWLLTSNVVTVGTSPLTYAQFSLSPSAPVSSVYTLSTVTANPAPAVVGTYYRTNYAASGSFTLPTSPATGSWVSVKQIANNTLTIVGTVDGNASFTMGQFQSFLFIYNGTTWDIT